ncbi:MAG TPA: pyridoxal-dependent decarboxylase, partial [Pseudonocardiaceae bacterium]
MHRLLAEDIDDLPGLLAVTRDVALRALAGLDTRPVVAVTAPAEPDPLPDTGIGLRATLAEFQRRWEPGFSGGAGPRYLGFVTGGTTPAALAGDWLTSAFDQNVGFAKDSSASALEHQTVAWLGELFGLSPAHSGAFVTGSTMSNLVGLAVAREWLGERRGVSVSDTGVGALGDVPVFSGTPHSSVYKALSVLGIGRDRMRLVPTLPGREAVDVRALAAALATVGGPAIVVANAGTVNTVDFDDLPAILALRDRFDFWLHVDGAFGAFAALSPDHAHLVAGLDGADSVCVDLHKWLNVPYDSAVQFTRRRDLQVAVFRNTAVYLGLPNVDSPDFVHLTPESSRRLRALPAWCALSAYGRDGHRDIVERNVGSAHRLGELLAASEHLRLLAPVRLNVVCFTLAERPTMDRVTALVDAVTASGETFLTPTVLDGVPGVRAAF